MASYCSGCICDIGDNDAFSNIHIWLVTLEVFYVFFTLFLRADRTGLFGFMGL